MEFNIGDMKFSVKKIDPFTQFHVLRRMGPIVPAVRGAIAVFKTDQMLAAGYLMAALSQLSDEDANFIINKCLGAAAIFQGSMWSPLVEASGRLMFQNLELPELGEIVWKVLDYNFRPFIPGLLARASGEAAQA